MCVGLLQLYSLSSLSSTILLENKQSQQQQERRRRFFFFLFSSCAHVSTPQSDNKRCDHTGINESNNLFTNFTNTEKQPWSRFAWEEGWGGRWIARGGWKPRPRVSPWRRNRPQMKGWCQSGSMCVCCSSVELLCTHWASSQTSLPLSLSPSSSSSFLLSQRKKNLPQSNGFFSAAC